ncbi:hypothetical protein NCS57_00182200 [Fusarium keratoplasticum]|uniref:Uncharacterized protein n=1 Tax=Fusarium keratoplasticum TaxID=1328300 RepID=A0ACC0RJ53_9HYPO|nr:hypothetical protein NCS57_00182200 [Fusarium keratoplasticum]KAI8685139.1 hypothetical protein NCS57_00182200 [Fusarium keratoplasticum]
MLDVDERQVGIGQVSVCLTMSVLSNADPPKAKKGKKLGIPPKVNVFVQSKLRPSIHLDSDDSNRAGSTPQRRTLIFPLGVCVREDETQQQQMERGKFPQKMPSFVTSRC